MYISKVILAGCAAGLTLTFASAQPIGSSQQDKALEVLRQRIAAERANASVPSGTEAGAQSVEKPSGAGSVAEPVKQPENPAALQNALNVLRDSIAKERQASQAAPVKAPAPVPPASPDPIVVNSLREAIAAQRKAAEQAPAPVSVEVPKRVPSRVVPSASPDPKVMSAVREALAAQRQASESAPTSASVEESSSAPAEKPVEPAQVVSPTPTPAPTPAPAPTVVRQPSGPGTKQHRLMQLLELYKADKVTPHEYHEQRSKIISE